MIAVILERHRHAAIFESYIDSQDHGIFYPLKVNERPNRKVRLFDAICLRTKGTPALRMRRDLLLKTHVYNVPKYPYALLAPTREYYVEFLNILDRVSWSRFAYVPWDATPRATQRYAGALRMSNCGDSVIARQTMRRLENHIDHSMRALFERFVTDDYCTALAYADEIEAQENEILKLTRHDRFITKTS